MSDKLRPVLYAIGVILLAALWLNWCHDPAVRADERLRIETRATDSTARVTDSLRVEMAYRESTLVSQLRRSEAASVDARRSMTRLRARLDDSTRAIVDTLLVMDSVALQPVRDSLVFWRTVATDRADIIERLTYERDSFQKQRENFRRRAEAPRHTKTDLAGGALIGWGVAEENKDAIALGLGLLVVPRLAAKLSGLLGGL